MPINYDNFWKEIPNRPVSRDEPGVTLKNFSNEGKNGMFFATVFYNKDGIPFDISVSILQEGFNGYFQEGLRRILGDGYNIKDIQLVDGDEKMFDARIIQTVQPRAFEMYVSYSGEPRKILETSQVQPAYKGHPGFRQNDEFTVGDLIEKGHMEFWVNTMEGCHDSPTWLLYSLEQKVKDYYPIQKG